MPISSTLAAEPIRAASAVREINHVEQLAGLRRDWAELLRRTPGGSFFQSLEWLETYWGHFGTEKRLRVMVVTAGERPVGILPLVVRTHRRRGIGLLRVLTYPLDDWGSFYGPIGASAAATLLMALDHVRRTPRDWDLIELPWVDALGTDGGDTPWALKKVGLRASAERWQSSALIDLAAHRNWESFWASRTARWRNNVRRSEKKLVQRGEVVYFRYRPAGDDGGEADPRWDLYDACEAIADASWQGASRTGTTLTHAAIRPFLRDCHQAAARAGALDLNLLTAGGKPAAFNYAYTHRGYVFGLRTGFDHETGGDGAGSVLQARMIEDCYARGDHTYDLGPGYLECKRYWQTHVRQSYRYTHFPAGAPLAQLVRLKRTIAGWLRRERALAAG